MNFLTRSATARRLFAGICVLTVNLASQTSFTRATYAQNTAKLEVPKIYAGQDFFEKSEIFRYEKTKKEKEIKYLTMAPKEGERPPKVDPDLRELNDIEQIYAGEIDNEKGTDILAAGDRKAFILDVQGKVKKVIDYNLGGYSDDGLRQNYNLPFIKIIDIDNDGKVEIVGHGVGICVILNLQGKTLWKYKITKKYTDPDSVDIGDVNGDGKNEIVIGIENRIEIFDLPGKKLGTFNYARETYEMLIKGATIVDFDSDGKNELLAQESIFSLNGEKIKEIKTPYSWIGTSVQENGKVVLMDFKNSKLRFFDTNENLIAVYDAPLSDLKRKPRYLTGYSLYDADAMWVKLFANEEKYLVVLAAANDEEEFDNFKMLYIYDSKKKLVYQETIEAFDSEMSFLPNTDGTESLLVTDDGKVNLYKVK